MLALLGFLLDGIELIPEYVLFALETAANAVLAALAASAGALMALLPSMPNIPSIGTPEWLGWLNWIYPVGELLDGLATAVAVFVAFLALRWALRLVRAL